MKRIYSPNNNINNINNNNRLELNGLITPSSTNVKLPLTTKNIFKNNGDNIIFKDYTSFTSPNNTNSERKETNKDLFHLESKINTLESKLIFLEQRNEALLAKINSNEENFDTKIKKLEINNFEEKKTLKKAENTIAFLNKVNNDNSAEIKKKISFIHNNLQKEEEYKNEQRKADIELQKNILNMMTDKIKETIKAEIDARFKADMENKLLNENIYKNTENEIMNLKKEIEEINNNIISKIKTVSKECSERAHNVSKYTDQQISNAIIGKNEIINNMKKYMEQFIMQVKNNITAQNSQNKLFDDRLKEAESHMVKTKNDNFGYMLEVEKRFEKKMNTLKKYFEINLKKHDNFLDSNMKNFALNIDKNFNFISGIIIDIREKENEMYKKYTKKSEEKFKSIISDLEKICERIYQYENSLNVFDKQNDLLKKNIAESLTAVKTRLDVHKVNQKILYTIENDLMQEQIIYLKKDLENSNSNIISNINEFKKNSQNSISSIMIELERHQKIIEKNDQYVQWKIKNIEKINMENDVKQVLEEMITNVETMNLIESMQNSKTSEFEINQIIQRQQNEINVLNKENRETKGKNIELDIKLNELEKKHENSYNNLTQDLNKVMQEQKIAKEIELSETVKNCLDKMVTNVENEITKEKMDDLSKFDLTKMTGAIADLSDKIKMVKNSSKANEDEINGIKSAIKFLEQDILKNKNNSQQNADLKIKLAMNQMLNNVEFNNIYSLLKNNKSQNIDFNEDFKQKCSEIVDNKIKLELEKVKIENETLWKKAVEANEKMNKPEEIKQVIDKVPPTILPINESAKRIMDVDYFNGENQNPKLPLLEDKLKLIEGDKEEKKEEKEKEINKKEENDNNKEDNKEENKEDNEEEKKEDNNEEMKENSGESKEENEDEEEKNDNENENENEDEEKNESNEKEEEEKNESNENEEVEEKESKKENEEEEEKESNKENEEEEEDENEND